MKTKRQPIYLNGQKIGRFKASFLLVKETFRFLRLDKEIMWFPPLSVIFNLVVFGLLTLVFFLAFPNEFKALMEAAENETEVNNSAVLWAYVFLVYVIGAFAFSFSQSGIAHIVYTRVRGGDASLGDGFGKALSLWFPLLVWSVITSTVGLILNAIAERSQLLMRIVVSIIGLAWAALTYFTIPVITIEEANAFSAIKKSGGVFKQTWGETLITNISLGLFFFVLILLLFFAMLGLIVFLVIVEGPVALFVLALVFFLVALLATSIVQASLSGVLRTLLYVYAMERTLPEGFNSELFSQILVTKNPTPPQQPVGGVAGSYSGNGPSAIPQRDQGDGGGEGEQRSL